jgi:mutator protein MutT
VCRCHLTSSLTSACYVGKDKSSCASSTTHESLIRVVAAVVSHGNELLVCQRPLNKRHGGLWEFPGGKCEPGESDLDAARRELSEELGVDVTTVGQAEFAVMDEGSSFHIVFVPTHMDGQPICHEHLSIAWRPLEQLVEWPLAPSDKRYVQHRFATTSRRSDANSRPC